MKNRIVLLSMLCLAFCVLPSMAKAAINDLTEWTLVEDPPHAGMSASATSSSATLTATGSVMNLTDIGYGSVNGVDVASSTQGYYFSPDEDFCVTIDFDYTEIATATGNGGFGFGIGQDVNGDDIAGAAASIVDGQIATYAATSQTAGTPTVPVPLGGTGVTEGTMIVEYVSSTGDIEVMVTGPGFSSIPYSFSGIQNGWTDEPLLVSFFLRSEAGLGSPFTSGTVETVFSNFQVTCGSASAIPEPTAALLLVCAAVPLAYRRG